MERTCGVRYKHTGLLLSYVRITVGAISISPKSSRKFAQRQLRRSCICAHCVTFTVMAQRILSTWVALAALMMRMARRTGEIVGGIPSAAYTLFYHRVSLEDTFTLPQQGQWRQSIFFGGGEGAKCFRQGRERSPRPEGPRAGDGVLGGLLFTELPEYRVKP